MTAGFRRIGGWLYRRAENIAAAMLAVMFLAFIVQVVFRYVLNLRTGWTTEITIIAWLWLVLWGAAFVVRENEEIRFDLFYGSVGPGVKRILSTLGAIALLAVYIFSFPAVFDYVTFMKVQSTAYLDIRFDFVFSIYLIFALAIIARYLWILWTALKGPPTDHSQSGETSPANEP